MRWLQDLPTTNLRILVSIGLAVVFVIGTMIASMIDRLPPAAALTTIAGFLLVMMGLDVAQFAAKRASFRAELRGVEPPAAPEPPHGSPTLTVGG